MTKYDKERQEEYERQRKEDEKMVQEAVEGANVAQAKKNAAEIGALASIADNAAQATAQQMSGGVGAKPQYEKQQEQKQNQAAIENAVAAVSSDTTQPVAEEKQPETKEIPPYDQSSMTPEEYQRVYGVAPVVEQAQGDNTSMTREEMERLDGGMQQQAPSNEGGEPVVNEGSGSGQAVVDSDLMRAAKDANAEREKQFSDIINDYYNRKQKEDREMRIQEQANMMSSMATGTTELAAGIINMLSVGELGATHQQYNNPTADWMKKADADIRANRDRRRNMADTLERLKMQEAELKAANRLEEAKLNHSLKKEKEEREWREREWQAKQDQIKKQNEVTEKELEMRQRAQERADKQADAAIAQRWSQINDSRKAQVATFLEAGYVPDKNSPSGYRYAPEEAKKWAGDTLTTKKGSGKSEKDKTIRIPLMASGNLPAETIEVESEEALKNTILANIDAVTDLMDSQKMEIISLMENDSIDADKKASLLKRYLVSSDQLRSLFRSNEGQQRASTFTGGQMDASAFLDALNQ